MKLAGFAVTSGMQLEDNGFIMEQSFPTGNTGEKRTHSMSAGFDDQYTASGRNGFQPEPEERYEPQPEPSEQPEEQHHAVSHQNHHPLQIIHIQMNFDEGLASL
jgi:hypothetical protein